MKVMTVLGTRPEIIRLPRGTATATGDGAWTYTATTNLPDGQQVVIEVTATDRPGHKTTKVQAKS
jgi:hypothetical protein